MTGLRLILTLLSLRIRIGRSGPNTFGRRPMLKNITDRYDAGAIEKEISQYWQEDESYRKTRELRKECPKFYFVDGPPYTTGHIHLGTAWNKIMKDAILRYTSMNGYAVSDTPGWDMHGLPIEVKVEGLLGFRSKKDIETFGVGNFIQECRKFAIGNKEAMTEQFKKIGIWMNWEKPYMTLKDEYIESAWWVTKQAHEKDLLDVGKRVVNWCPRCETAIADSEVEYADRKDSSIYVKFPLKGEKDAYIVIWTTTPWTIPSNVAVAVNPDIEYARIKAVSPEGKEEILIMGKDMIPLVLRRGKYQSHEIIAVMKGTELQGLEYTSPLAEEVPMQATIPHAVYPADYVVADNTGCVHIAPGHGLDDFNVGVKYGLPVICPVGPNGNYTKDAGKYAGMNIRDANPIVIEDLRAKGCLLSEGTVEHRYGHCWRCKTPIIFLATEQWFIDIVKVKETMLSEIEKVSWYPEWAGSARFHDWIEGARDWCISRQRYWGIPIPIWTCAECGRRTVIGTKQELIEKAGLTGDIELHRPYVDDVKIKCDSCGAEMKRTTDVFDVWFDSAMASWATVGFPKEKEKFEKLWPADLILEGQDQTRGWFYSQLGASVTAFGKAPYKSVLMHGFTLDAGGKKMSKSLGNVIAPEDVVEKHGADALRAYIISACAPWDDLKFSWEEVANVTGTLNTLWNVYKFPLPYMTLDHFDPAAHPAESVIADMREEDKWILSRLQTLIRDVNDAMAQRLLHKAARSVLNYILEDLSRWYIQLVRPRTWTEADDPDKIAAYATLYEVLTTLTKVIAPFMPFMAEEMYQNLVRNVCPDAPSSVHMNDWPEVKEIFLNPELEEYMDIVREIVRSSSNARQKAGRKLRWPVSRIVVTPKDEKVQAAVSLLRSVLLDQTNAKDIVIVPVGESWKELNVRLIPNNGVLGPKFRQNAKKVADFLLAADAASLRDSFTYVESVEGTLEDGTTIEITPDMVNFEEFVPEGIAGADSDVGMVYVDAVLTKELEAEGYMREVIRRVQDMRKTMDLPVDAVISVKMKIADERVSDLVSGTIDTIRDEVRAKDFDMKAEPAGDFVVDWDVEGVSMHIGVSKA